jgi:hypothetical protein
MQHRQRDIPFFHKSHAVARGGGTRVDVRRWSYVGLVLALVGLAGWLYLEQASQVASFGHDIRQLERRKERLRREVTALHAEVAIAGSLSGLHAVGQDLEYALPSASDTSRYRLVPFRAPDDGNLAPTGPGVDARAGASSRDGGTAGLADLVDTVAHWLGIGATGAGR